MNFEEAFKSIKSNLLNIDPVYFCENNLMLDGAPFRLNGNGYKPLADIYRYIGIKSLERKGSKPVVVVKGRQVGLTTLCSALELFFVASRLFGTAGRPPMRVMHCFPQLELAYAYTKTKLNPMISGAVVSKNQKKNKVRSVIEECLDSSVDASNSLSYKQFIDGNHIWIESTGINADRLRGRTIDCIFFDETQDIRKEALSNATKILSKSRYGLINNGVQLYFGTPKQSGTAYWEMWNKSSKQYYYLGCEKCKEYFQLYTPGSNEWERIWIDDDLPKDHPSHGFMVQCTHCDHIQDKRPAAERGKWVALNDSVKNSFIGYHINQLYMPTFTKWDIISQKPEHHPVNTERAYQNEVLGEFFSGSSAPITAEELYNLCADKERRLTSSISINEPRKVYAGFDWGQKVDLDLSSSKGENKKSSGQSYSCAVILTSDGPHILSIEFATKLKQNKLQDKRDIVEQMFRQYSVKLAVGDIGYANDLTEILHTEHGDRFLGSSATGSIRNHIKFDPELFPKTIQFERDFYIAELYDLMKNGKIRFPYGDYEKIGWLINHCTSMEIKVTQDRSGSLKQHYVKGSTPNDGFMSLLNAYLAYKFDITQGFKIHNPNNMNKDPTERRQIPCVLGYLPRMNNKKN